MGIPAYTSNSVDTLNKNNQLFSPFLDIEKALDTDLDKMSYEEIEECVCVLSSEADRLINKLKMKAHINKPLRHLNEQQKWEQKYGPGFAQWLTDDLTRMEDQAA